MLEKVRLALRISTSAFDGEIIDLIDAAKADLGVAGVTSTEEEDPLIIRAVITYCKMHFGQSESRDFDRLKESYIEQKAQLATNTGHTNWG